MTLLRLDVVRDRERLRCEKLFTKRKTIDEESVNKGSNHEKSHNSEESFQTGCH